MPKQISPKDRLLAYAFTATAEELQEAVSIFTAALKAKAGPTKRKAPAPRRPTPSRVPNSESASSGGE